MNEINLSWQDGDQPNTDYYEIEKSTNAETFITIGKTTNTTDEKILSMSDFHFTDHHPGSGDNYYRIKSVGKDGGVHYSNVFDAGYDAEAQTKFYIAVNSSGNSQSLIGITSTGIQGMLVIYNETGQMIREKNVQLSPGMNTIDIPKNLLPKYSVGIVSLYLGNKLAFSQKTVF
jgi:hypothetical protein